MKLSRIDYIGLNGGDGLHYPENLPESEKEYQEWLAQTQNFCYTNIDMWNSCWEIAQKKLLEKLKNEYDTEGF